MSFLRIRALSRRCPKVICHGRLSNKSVPFCVLRRSWQQQPFSGRSLSVSSSNSTGNANSNKNQGQESILSLPSAYLRAMDSSCYDPKTLQRSDVPFDNDSGKPRLTEAKPSHKIKRYSVDDQVYRIYWEDGHESEFSTEWLEQQQQRWTGDSLAAERVLWTDMTEEQLRSSPTMSIRFSEVISSEAGMRLALRSMYQYGVLLVTNTPVHDDGVVGVAALASALGGGSVKNQNTILHNYRLGGNEIMLPRGTDGPLRTLYGTVWSTTSSGQAEGASVADSAYGNDALPLHTDMTYHRDPPGLQIFTMVSPALHGGESVFADGFAAAERLKSSDPDAFATLSTILRRYRSVDKETGWCLESSNSPVISVHSNGQVVAIRHNDLDRCPDLPPHWFSPQQIYDFYDKLERAHQSWDTILSQDDLRLEISLREGDTVVVANQRCFHGRRSFQTDQDSPRSVTGCYVSQDELNSRFRMEGFHAI